MSSRVSKKSVSTERQDILWFKDISIVDVPLVGGKNASLGEMYSKLTKQGIHVPNGFALTADAYWHFLESTGLRKKIKELLKDIDVHNLKQLTTIGKKIRQLILAADIPKDIEKNILAAYKILGAPAVAVRSSATAEDLPDASFAGQQETYLNVQGNDALMQAIKKCIASLFTNRAISYREAKGFGHLHVALSVTVQQMVQAAASGVMFTVDTESGFDKVILINASYGLGEYVVKGRVSPDQFYVFKPGIAQGKKSIISRTIGSKEVKLVYGKRGGTRQQIVSQRDRDILSISESDVVTLSEWGMAIEQHYHRPQDIEWVKEEKTGKLFIVQARPETVTSRRSQAILEQYVLKAKGKELLRGISVGQRIGAGKVAIIDSPSKMKEFKKGEVLVTRITDPDWEPIMRLASAIVTEQGGKTSHAAIVSRELGVPCIVGAKDARKVLKNGKKVTVSCANGDEGIIYDDVLPFEVKRTEVVNIPQTKTKIMMNIGDPDHAFSLSFLPHDGIGLARLEFIFTNFIRIHPLALVHYASLKDAAAKKQIATLTRGYKKKTDYCVDKLAEGVARIAAAAYDRPVIVRLSDFKTNEYATLIGGKEFEPKEENPMIGWRGASRYYSDEYKPAFALECEAIKKARDEWGLHNIVVMVPFCRTPEEAEKVLATMASFGLTRGENGLQVYVMCEIPSNVILAEEFAQLFDGFSIGSNDLTQLTLGVDRDSGNLMDIGDATSKAVKTLIKQVIDTVHKQKKHIGICGQAPSDYPEFAEYLVSLGIDSMSLNPDTVVETKQRIAAVEKTLGKKGNKTHISSLSFIAIMGMMSAALMTLGVGCQAQNIIQPQSTDQYIAPAIIRERIEERVEQQKIEERKTEMSSLQVRNALSLSLQYPTGWEVEQWSGGLTVRAIPQETNGAYVSIYKQLVEPPIINAQTSTVMIDGRTATRIDRRDASGTIEHSVIEVERDGEVIIIEGRGESFDSIISSIRFVDTSGDITDRSPTHWDQREGRLCAQVITYARSGADTSCQPFSTPCDVPDNWEVCDASDTQ